MPNSLETLLFPQHRQRLEQWRSILAAADRDADWLEHLTGLNSQLLCGSSQGLIERIVREVNLGKNLLRLVQNFQRHRCVSLLRYQLSRIIGRQLVYKEEVRGC